VTRVSVHELVVAFDGPPVLSGVSVDVPHGELLAIVGPSGCGKTTLLRTIAGLERAISGEIRLGMRMVTTHGVHMAPDKRRVGWVPQDAALFPQLTVAENVAFGFGVTRASRRSPEARDRVAQLLDLVNLTPLANRMPAQLSGGQAQRVALARALAVRPDVVLLDEPFAALDALLRAELRAEVRALLLAEEVTGILVTHDQAEALSMADRVAVMHDGRVLQSGRPDEVYGRPATPWVAGFVGDSSFLPGRWHGGLVDCAFGSVEADWVGGAAPLESTPATVLVRPENVRVERVGSGGGLLATVTAVSYSGHDALLEVLLDDGSRCLSRVAASGLLPIATRVEVSLIGTVLVYPEADSA